MSPFRLFTLALATICLIQSSLSCNEAVCASIVSKCMITQQCKCDIESCSCCKECYHCLRHLFSECCSCVDLCPKPNSTITSLSSQSHIEDLTETIPQLFQVLTSEPDTHNRWSAYNYPVDIEMASVHTHYTPGPIHTLYASAPDHSKYGRQDMKYSTKSIDSDILMEDMVNAKNCTVAFISDCIPWKKCKVSCQSMGAVSFRWFHDGCCECIGENCINYGIGESRCENCPPLQDDLFIEESELDYGED